MKDGRNSLNEEHYKEQFTMDVFNNSGLSDATAMHNSQV